VKAQIFLDRSEACAEAHGLDVTHDSVVIDYDLSDGPWVGFLYESLRTQEGDPILYHDGKDGCWFYDGEPFSDVTINFVAAHPDYPDDDEPRITGHPPKPEGDCPDCGLPLDAGGYCLRPECPRWVEGGHPPKEDE
jgi:hypothetical protein